MPKHGRQRNRRHGEKRQFPEIATSPEPGPTERLDELDHHEPDDDKGEEFRHAAFDQQRLRLSKRFLRSLTKKKGAAILNRNAAPL